MLSIAIFKGTQWMLPNIIVITASTNVNHAFDLLDC